MAIRGRRTPTSDGGRHLTRQSFPPPASIYAIRDQMREFQDLRPVRELNRLDTLCMYSYYTNTCI